jgi:membrane-associated phospholipid phosphatase
MKTMKSNLTLTSFFVLLLTSSLVLTTPACQKDSHNDNFLQKPPKLDKPVKDYNSKVVQEWQSLFLEIERYAEVYRPSPAARMLGYVGLAAYEANISGMPDYQSLDQRIPRLNVPNAKKNLEYNWAVVTNSVYATLFRSFFARVKQADMDKISALEKRLNMEFEATTDRIVMLRSKNFGVDVAISVWNYSTTDAYGHNQYLNARPTSYTPPTGEGLWQPTAPNYAKAMFPYWGKARTFAIKESEKLARPPLPYSENKNSAYYKEGKEIYEATSPQTDENQWIAEFWSDDVLGFTFSPPARWIAIANQVLELENANLETAILAAVKVGLALNDASVACWYSKYHYNIERPVTYINKMFNPNWNVASLTSTGFLQATPSFPAYPSGHSTFGAAAAEALTSVFGDNYKLTDNCHKDRRDFNGTPRTFNSFYEMAEENAYSRIYLGVHWRMDCEEGLRLGYEVGKTVNALPFSKLINLN